MTVQSIDKRVIAEANMTTASQDKQQGAVSAEDAFTALLQQTSQRFGNKAAGSATPDKALADHFSRKPVEAKADKPQAARDDNQQDRTPAAKDPRPTAKADKARPAPAKDPAAKAVVKDDAPAPAASASDDDGKTVAAADDDAPKSNSGSADDKTGQNDVKTQAPQVETVAVAAQQQMVVEIDITVEETVQVVQIDASARNTQADATDQAAQADANQAQNTGKDLLAGLSKDDRQRITDLENRIIDDLDSGDADDALDAATELVTQLINKAGQQQSAGLHSHAHDMAKTDTAKQQADDLAAMLAGTGAQLDVKVQVNQAVTETPTQAAAAVVDAMAQMDMTAQNQQSSGQGQNQGPQQQGPKTADPLTAVQTAPLAAAMTEQPVEAVNSFSAVLAAQAEAGAQDVKDVPKPNVVAGLAAVGATQATEKSSPAQSAQSARAPRIPLQQQVMEQVSVQIDKAVKDGNDTVKIQLRPLDLGKIEIKLEMVDGRVSATVTAERPETLALLQKDSKGLEKALEDAGLKPDANSTSFSLKNGEQQNNADRGNNNGQRRSRGRGHGGDAETAAIGAAQAAQPRSSGGRAGVDISV